MDSINCHPTRADDSGNTLLKQILDSDAGLKNLLNGTFSQVDFINGGPRLKLKQIRLFLCSEFEEFKAEREIFWSDVLPEIQQHCMQYGVDILAFDPYQGLPDGQCADLLTQPFYFHHCLKQIEACKLQSEGVFFLCFLGMNPGPSTVPIFLSAEMFDSIRMDCSGTDIKVLNNWYKLDKNSNPPFYELQNYKFKNCMMESDMVALLKLINKYDDKRERKTNGSVLVHNSCLEQMIDKAVNVEGQYPKAVLNNCLFFVKNCTDDNDDKHTVELRTKLASILEKPNLIQLQSDKIHQFPLNQSSDANGYFAHQLTYKIKQLVDRTYANGYDWLCLKSQPAVEHFFFSHVEIGQLFEQIRFHFDLLFPLSNAAPLIKARFSDSISSSTPEELIAYDAASDKSECLRNISKWCQDATQSASRPIVIQGDEGSGKTTVLRRIATLVPKWLGGEVVIVARFVNSCASAKYAHELLRGICMQICLVYELWSLMDDFKGAYTTDKVFRFFDQACAHASVKAAAIKKPLILLLDDLHQLKYATYASGRTFNICPWMPRELPKNVVLICAITKSFLNTNMLPIKLDSNGRCHVNLIQVPVLSADDLFGIVSFNLASKRRTLSTEQELAIKKFLSTEPPPSPLFAKFLGRECCTWNSSFAPASQCLSSKITTYFINIIEKLEKIYMPVLSPFDSLIGAWCSYLECARYGLTEAELWELIGENVFDSLQHSTENDENKEPPAYGYSVPCMMWLILKDMFANLVEEVFFDGKIVLNWDHVLINSAVRFRFLRTNPELKVYHRNISEMYRWSEYNNNDDQDEMNGNKPALVARLSAPQYFHPSTGQIIYDRRAAHNFWYHIFQAGTVSDFEEQSLCNYAYLDSLLNVTNLSHLLSIFEEVLTQILDHNLHVLYGTVVRPSVETLACSTKHFAAELIGRLNFTRSRNTEILNSLLNQSMYWVDNVSIYPIIVPLTSWIRPPLCPLVTSLKVIDCTPGMSTIVQPTLNYQHLLVAGYLDGRILMYHILSNTVVKTFVGHADRVLCMQLSNNGLYFATGSSDNSIRFWSLQQGSCIKSLEQTPDKPLCMTFSKDDKVIFTGLTDCSIKMITFENGSLLKIFVGHTGAVSALVLTNENEYLISGSFDFVALVWHVASGNIVYKLGGMMAPVSCLGLTSSDTFLVIACADETLRVFSLCLAKELHELRGHQANITSLVVAPDDCQLFAGSADGSIYCYDLHNGQMVATQKCATSTISCLKITKGNRFLISAGVDAVQVWSIDRPIDHWKSETTPTITVCKMSKDCKYLAVGNSSGAVLLWDLEACRYLWAVHYEFRVKITCLAFDYDNELLFSGSIDGLICIWSITNGRLKKSVRHHTSMIRYIQFFHNKPRVLSHDSTGVVKIWRPFINENEEEGKDVEEFNVGGDLLQLANDRDLISTSSCCSKELRIWNVGNEDTPAYVRAKLSHKDAITCLNLSSNAKFVLTGSKDDSIKLWEVSTGYLTQVFVGHDNAVISCAMNDDSQVAVSGSIDGSVMSWDVETGSTMSTVNHHPNTDVNSVAVFNDGLIVLAGYGNGWLHASSTETGQEIASFNAHLPILEILNCREGSRIILRLSQGPRLAVVCLHNCPQLSEMLVDSNGVKHRRRSSRALSLTSGGSEGGVSLMSAASTNVTVPIKRSVSPLVTLKGLISAAGPAATLPTSASAAPSVPPTNMPTSKFPMSPSLADDDKKQVQMTPSAEKAVLASFADKRPESRNSKVFAAIERSRSSRSCLLEDQTFCGSAVLQRSHQNKNQGASDRPGSTSNQNVSKVCSLM